MAALFEPKMLLTIFLMGTIVYITYLSKRNATASDFFVGGRSFGWFTNGSAIGGDYLSAATFLGIAGLTFQLGYDGAYYTKPGSIRRDVARAGCGTGCSCTMIRCM